FEVGCCCAYDISLSLSLSLSLSDSQQGLLPACLLRCFSSKTRALFVVGYCRTS
ncbi:unnamed protein product, partial [Sphagnum jensenii]